MIAPMWTRSANREVWVTGAGVSSAVGKGVDSLYAALCAEQSGVRPNALLNGTPAGSTPDPLRTRATRHLGRNAALFVAAADDAWHDAELDGCDLDLRRAGVIEGSSLGPMADVLATHAKRLSDNNSHAARPSDILRFMSGAGGAAVSQQRGLQIPALHLSAGSVSATCAIGEALKQIASGAADIMIAGGAECPLHPEIVRTFRAAGTLSHAINNDPPCCPFDERRSGTVLGEGAGVLILESAEHARRRGARARVIISGYSLTGEAYSMVAPEPNGTGVAEAAGKSLRNVSRRDVSWIKTHGTGTRLNDLAECRGLASAFGADLENIPLVSFKPMLGHALGASGAVEAVATAICIERGIVPATLGTTVRDPALPRCKVSTRVETRQADSVLLLSESFGGRCAALVMSHA